MKKKNAISKVNRVNFYVDFIIEACVSVKYPSSCCVWLKVNETEWETTQTGRDFEPSEAGCMRWASSTHTHFYSFSACFNCSSLSTCTEYWFHLFVSLPSLTVLWLHFYGDIKNNMNFQRLQPHLTDKQKNK